MSPASNLFATRQAIPKAISKTLFQQPARFFVGLIFWCMLIGVEKGWGQVVVAGWDVSTQPGGANNFGASPLAPTTANSNVTIGSLTRGSGVGTSGTGAGGAFGGTAFNGTSSAAQISANGFFTFSVNVNPGLLLSMSSISKFDYRRSPTGATTGLLQYQINSGGFIDIASYNFSSSASSGASLGSTDLSTIAGLQSLPSTAIVTFRIVPFAASGSGGTWYIFDVSNTTADDFSTVGTISCASTSNFYSKSTGTLNITSTWGTNTDGSGAAPTNFTNSCQVFNIRNGNSGTLSSAWAVSGGGSKIVVENTDFTIASTNAATGTIDVNASRTLTLQNATLPTLGTLSPTSTVIYNQTGSFTPTANTYGNIILNNTSLTNPGGSIDWTLAGSISLTNGAAFNAGNLGINTTGALDQTISGGNINIRSMDHTLKTNGNFTFGSNSNITITSGSLTGTFTGISNQFIDSGNSITVGNNVTLGGNSSGYNLTGTLILNATLGTANLRGDGSGLTPIAAQLNNLISNVSGSTSTSFRPISGTNTIIVKGNVSISGVGTGSVFFNANTISIGGSFFNDRTANDIIAGTSTLVFYGTGIHSFVSSVAGGITLYNLLVNKNGTISQNGNLLITSVLGISNGTWDAQTNTLSSSTAILSMTGGTLRLAKTGTTLPELSGTYLNTGGTIELYGNGSQTLRGSRDYATLLFTANTVSSVTSAPNSFTGIGIANNAILDIQSFDVGGNFRTLTMTGSSLLRTSGSGTVPPMGDLYTLSPNTTIEIYGTNASTSIRQGPTTGGTQPHRYQNLLFSGVTTITAPANVLRVEGNIINNLSTGIFKHNSGTLSLTGTNQTISGTAIADFYNLNLDANTIANLASSQRLINTISLSNGAVFNANGNLTLVSNNLGTARIGRILTGAVVNGNVILQRYLPGKATSPNMIYQITSPLVGNAITNWQGSSSLTGIYITGNFIGKSVSTVTGVFNTAGSSLFSYNASNGTFLATPSVGGVNADLLSVGTGYRAFVRDGTASYGFGSVVAKTISSVGTITSGTIPFNIIYNNALTNTGWNLLGNPYPSEISGDLQDANAWPTRTNVNGAIYIWNSTAAGYNTYIDGVGVLAGTGAWNGVIPSSQAFWVRGTATGASLSVAEFAKVSTTTGAIWRTESQSILRIALLSGNDANETIIRFKPGATPNFDGNFDAEKLDAQAGGASVSIASYSNNKAKRLSINSLPPIIKAGSDTVFLDVSMPLGSNSLHFSQSETIDNATNIFLLDQFDNQLIDLKLNAQYNFSVTTIVGSKDRNRFALVFSNAAYLNADSIIVLSDSVGSNGVLQLESNADWIAKSSTDWFEITSQNANAISIKALIANNSKALKIGIITLSGNGLIDRYIAVNQKFKLTDSSSTNTNDEISDFKFEVHPNPLHKLQDLTVSSSASIHPATIQIYDLIGKLVYHKLIKTDLSQTFTIQLPSTISSGVFLIVYGSPMRILNKKLIITD